MSNNDFCPLPSVLSELFAKVAKTGWLHSCDRQIIRNFLLQEELCEESQRIINRLLYSVRQHQIQVTE